jgi:hypothetical protein
MTQDSLGVFTPPTWSLNDPNSNDNKPFVDNVKYNDHIASILRNAKTANNTIAISGANEKAEYSISGHFQKTGMRYLCKFYYQAKPQ